MKTDSPIIIATHQFIDLLAPMSPDVIGSENLGKLIKMLRVPDLVEVLS